MMRHSQFRSTRASGGSKVDSSDSPQPRQMAGHNDGQPESLAGQAEDNPRAARSNDQIDGVLRNSGLLCSGERLILAVRKHPAALTGFVFMTVAGMIAAALLSD